MSGIKRYQDPEVYERLAAEYVLGTLKGKALARFERLVRERPYIRYAVEVWEGRLNPLAELADEVRPSPAVWKAIQSQISATSGNMAVESPPSKIDSFWQRLGFWQAATAMLSVLIAVLVLVPKMNQHMPMPSYVAVLESEANTPMMVTLGDERKRMVAVRLMQKPERLPGHDLQLWAMQNKDADPVPVGVINTNGMETQMSLSRAQWQKIRGAKIFAISVEPEGGSPTGLPSSPIMYKGRCLDFI
ncbi:MAG TPA: hypothetical protein ENJ84_09845 [Gammaproteobacteria bacterium]|nr:hypothetical protein [Gammaproteobacteria bacterium]